MYVDVHTNEKLCMVYDSIGNSTTLGAAEANSWICLTLGFAAQTLREMWHLHNDRKAPGTVEELRDLVPAGLANLSQSFGSTTDTSKFKDDTRKSTVPSRGSFASQALGEQQSHHIIVQRPFGTLAAVRSS